MRAGSCEREVASGELTDLKFRRLADNWQLIFSQLATSFLATGNFPPLLRCWQLPNELRQILRTGAFSTANVVAAGCHTGAEAFFQVETQYLPEAKAGVEMIARASADFRLLNERPRKLAATLFGGSRRATARVYDNAR